jgi:hypothetical protein
MPVATTRHLHAPRTQEVQPNAVHKYEAPWREAEHQTFHQSAGDVFRHRTVHVDARTSDPCATPHTIRCQRDPSPALARVSVGLVAIDIDVPLDMSALLDPIVSSS